MGQLSLGFQLNMTRSCPGTVDFDTTIHVLWISVLRAAPPLDEPVGLISLIVEVLAGGLHLGAPGASPLLPGGRARSSRW